MRRIRKVRFQSLLEKNILDIQKDSLLLAKIEAKVDQKISGKMK